MYHLLLFTHSSVELVDIPSLELQWIIQPSHSYSCLWTPICAFLLGYTCRSGIVGPQFFVFLNLLNFANNSQSSWADFYPCLPKYTLLYVRIVSMVPHSCQNLMWLAFYFSLSKFSLDILAQRKFNFYFLDNYIYPVNNTT